MRTLPRGAWAAAAGLVLVLALVGGRYGFHRDELYFVAAGRHPAWGYPDQPPLVPLLATGWYTLTGGTLWLFRLLPALLVGALVLVGALTSRELGGDRREQACTAVLVAVCSFVVAVGHLFSTTTFDVLGSALVVLLLLRAVDVPDLRRWLLAGLATGVTLQVKTLVVFLLVGVLVGLLIAGPPSVLRRPGPWLAAVTAAVIGAPYLAWQAAHGFPQLEVAADIASGGSVSSTSRAMLVPEQLLIAGPIVGVLLVVGLVVLLRSPRFRWVGAAYLVFLALMFVTGGKAYYLASLFPVLLAAAAPPVLRRADRHRVPAGVLLVAHVAGTALISLPLAPATSGPASVALAVNPDQGETYGWDRIVTQVAGLVDQEGPADAILTSNYGEAGALDRARRRGTPLPPAYSGHNAYAEWGPPPASVRSVMLVGFADPGAWFTGCRRVGTLATGIDNEEDGSPVDLCDSPKAPWPTLWPELTHLG